MKIAGYVWNCQNYMQLNFLTYPDHQSANYSSFFVIAECLSVKSCWCILMAISNNWSSLPTGYSILQSPSKKFIVKVCFVVIFLGFVTNWTDAEETTSSEDAPPSSNLRFISWRGLCNSTSMMSCPRLQVQYTVQGRIYKGAKGASAPGPPAQGAPLKSKNNVKI